jgi:hypothetical protein
MVLAQVFGGMLLCFSRERRTPSLPHQGGEGRGEEAHREEFRISQEKLIHFVDAANIEIHRGLHGFDFEEGC